MSFKLFATLLTIVGLVGCNWSITAKPDQYEIVPLTLETSRAIGFKIDAAADRAKIFKFNSQGGNALTGIALARYMETRDVHMSVNYFCGSACAELLLPAAAQITFKNDPMIAFHGNLFSAKYFTDIYSNDLGEKCTFRILNRISSFYERRDVNGEFWKTQMEVLKPNVGHGSIGKKCGAVRYNFENHAWLPSSGQLRENFGLKFDGAVCADNYEKCAKKVDYLFAKDKRIVIADKVHVSLGLDGATY